MVQMRNRKMPTRGTARCLMALASLLALLFGIQPTAVFLIMVSLCCASIGMLSVPRASYLRVLGYSFASGLVPAVIAGLLTRSPANAVAAFTFAPAAALLVLTIRRRNTRSAGIFWATVAMTVTLIGSALLALWMHADSLSFSVFKQLYLDVRTVFVDYVKPILESNSDAFFMSELDPAKFPYTLFTTLATLLPGVFIMTMWLMAWLSTVFLRRIFLGYVYGFDRFHHWPVTVWRPIGWVYIVSFVLAALPINGFVYAVIAAVANNVQLILLPIFTIIGCRMIKERLMRLPGCGCATILMLGIMAFSIPGIPLILLAFTGAWQTAMPPKHPPFTPPFPPPFGGDSNTDGPNGYTDRTNTGYRSEEDADGSDYRSDYTAENTENTDDTDSASDSTESDDRASDDDHPSDQGGCSE